MPVLQHRLSPFSTIFTDLSLGLYRCCIGAIGALMFAAGEGHVELCRELLELGADPNLVDNVGLCCFVAAAA